MRQYIFWVFIYKTLYFKFICRIHKLIAVFGSHTSFFTIY